MLSFSSGQCIGDEDLCLTTRTTFECIPGSTQNENITKNYFDYNRQDEFPTLTINIYFHIIQNSAGNGNNFTTSSNYLQRLNDLVNDVNSSLDVTGRPDKNIFSPNLPAYPGEAIPPTIAQHQLQSLIENKKIRYNVIGISFHNTTYFYDLFRTSTIANQNDIADNFHQTRIKTNSNFPPNVRDSCLHIIIASHQNDLFAQGVCSWFVDKKYTVLFDYSKLTYPYQYTINYVATFIHETGHNFGLFHDWEIDACSDTPRFTANEGDCTGQLQTNPLFYNPNTNQPYPCSNNWMAYNVVNGAYTWGQLGRIRYHLLNTELLDVVKKDYCTYHAGSTIIIGRGQDVHWYDKKLRWGDVVVQNGGKLTIHCTIHIPKDGMIKVEAGGKLRLAEGGSVTNICGDQWKGIEVWGVATSNHTGDPRAAGYVHGFVELDRNATISNAYKGVYSGTCGVIYADTVNFINCRWGISMDECRPNGTMINNISYIKDCNFTANAAVPNTGGQTIKHAIATWGVDNLEVHRNTFNQNFYSDNNPTQDLEAIDIYNGVADIRYNVVNGWKQGIVVSNLVNNNTNQISNVRDNRINGCRYGLRVYGPFFRLNALNNVVKEIPAEPSKLTLYGFYLDRLREGIIMYNRFDDIDNTAIYINNAQPRCPTSCLETRINYNYFSNLTTGLYTEGDNRLDVMCNRFFSTVWEAWVNTGKINFRSSTKTMGTSTLAADNLFLGTDPYQTDIYSTPAVGYTNADVTFNYYHSQVSGGASVCTYANLRPQTAGFAYPQYSIYYCADTCFTTSTPGGGMGLMAQEETSLAQEVEDEATTNGTFLSQNADPSTQKLEKWIYLLQHHKLDTLAGELSGYQPANDCESDMAKFFAFEVARYEAGKGILQCTSTEADYVESLYNLGCPSAHMVYAWLKWYDRDVPMPEINRVYAPRTLHKEVIEDRKGGAKGSPFAVLTKIEPNPAQDELRLAFADIYNIQVSIVDWNGQVRRTINVQDYSLTLNIQDLPQGVYTCKVLKSGEMVTQRTFVKL